MSKSYFGDKEVLKVVLDGRVMYEKTNPPTGGEKEVIFVTQWTSGYLSNNRGEGLENAYADNSRVITGWIDVKPNSTYLIEFPSSNRCILQFRAESSASITNATAPYGTTTANGKTFTVPDGKTRLRIYFLDLLAGATHNTTEIKRLVEV